MTKVKVTTGWLKRGLPIAIEQSRLNMYYTWEVSEKKVGWFKKEKTRKPVKDSEEYWDVMKLFYPWNQVEGITFLIENGKPLTTLEVDAVLVSRMMEAVNSGE